MVRHFQEYTEPMEGSTTGATRRTHPNPLHPAASNTDDDKVLLPLGESTLSNNLGIPVIVVVAKVSSTFLHSEDRKAYFKVKCRIKIMTLTTVKVFVENNNIFRYSFEINVIY